ncbi:MAG: hypothetical protein QXJ17_03935 [Nitrososphaeria archaeon]
MEELLEDFQKDPDKLLLTYERVISEEFLDKCDAPEKYWLFLIFKFSISYLNETKNVFNFHFDSIKRFYDNEIPPPIRGDMELAKLLDNEQYRNQFLNRIYSVRRDIYLKLSKMLVVYDRFKIISNRDEELEKKLNRKLAIFRITHAFKFNKFIKEIENNQPSLRQYISLIYT